MQVDIAYKSSAGNLGSERAALSFDFVQLGEWQTKLIGRCKDVPGLRDVFTTIWDETIREFDAALGDGQGEKGIPAVQHLEWLHQNIVSHFNQSELRDLYYFGMGIDYDDLPGQSKNDKARELIAYCQRYSRLDDLVAKLRELHPNVPWEGEHE